MPFCKARRAHASAEGTYDKASFFGLSLPSMYRGRGQSQISLEELPGLPTNKYRDKIEQKGF